MTISLLQFPIVVETEDGSQFTYHNNSILDVGYLPGEDDKRKFVSDVKRKAFHIALYDLRAQNYVKSNSHGRCKYLCATNTGKVACAVGHLLLNYEEEFEDATPYSDIIKPALFDETFLDKLHGLMRNDIIWEISIYLCKMQKELHDNIHMQFGSSNKMDMKYFKENVMLFAQKHHLEIPSFIAEDCKQ